MTKLGGKSMKKLLIGFAVAIFSATGANAALLATYSATDYLNSSSGGSNDGGMFFEFGIDPTPGTTDIFGAFPSIFGDTLLTADTVLTVTSGAGFDNFANLVTNGTDEQFFIAEARNIGGSPVQAGVGWGPESGVFGAMSTASTNGIDLEGFVITSLVLTIENLQAAASNSGYLFDLDFRVDVYGEAIVSDVPLPAAAPLMLMGLGGIAAMRRRKRAKA